MMNSRERQAWIIAASVFVTLFLVWGGGVNTGPVFLPPLLKGFGWTRARVSTLGSAGALIAGACGPIVGWLVDRIDTRRVTLAGVLTVAVGLIVASRADSYYLLLAANLMIARRHSCDADPGIVGNRKLVRRTTGTRDGPHLRGHFAR